jgi:hypothetical protein
MRARRWARACAALAAILVYAGCRAIDGLGSLSFDGGDAGAAGAAGAGDAPDADAPDADAGDAGGASCPPANEDCEAPPPQGWSGPIAIYEGAPDQAPACPTDYPTPVLDGGITLASPPAATCTVCQCSVPAVTCDPDKLSTYSQYMCGGAPDVTLMLTSGTCTSLPGMSDHFYEYGAQASAGACTPSGGVPDGPPPAWATVGVGCGVTGPLVTCADGAQCAPLPASPFAARWCIWATGANTCPAAFPQAHAWKAAQDGRGCDPCSCGSPTAATCTATTELYEDTMCLKSLVAAMPGQCTSLGIANAVTATLSPSGSASCAASGGSATGAVAVVPQVTVCCPQ